MTHPDTTETPELSWTLEELEAYDEEAKALQRELAGKLVHLVKGRQALRAIIAYRNRLQGQED